MVNELCIDQSVVTIEAEHHVVPEVVDQCHIPQVDHVVGIAVNLVTIVVQVLNRSVKERAEGDTQNPIDDRSASVRVPSVRNHRAIPFSQDRAIGSYGRGQGTIPAPGVVRIVPVEVIAVVVVTVIKPILGIVTRVVAFTASVVVTGFASLVVVLASAVAAPVDAAVTGLASLVAGVDVAGLAAAALVVASLIDVAGLAAAALGDIGPAAFCAVVRDAGPYISAIALQTLAHIGWLGNVAAVSDRRGEGGAASVIAAAAGAHAAYTGTATFTQLI